MSCQENKRHQQNASDFSPSLGSSQRSFLWVWKNCLFLPSNSNQRETMRDFATGYVFYRYTLQLMSMKPGKVEEGCRIAHELDFFLVLCSRRWPESTWHWCHFILKANICCAQYLQGEQKFLLRVARPKNLPKEMKDFIIPPTSEEDI